MNLRLNTRREWHIYDTNAMCCAWIDACGKKYGTKRSKGCLIREGMLHMVFKLGQCAEKDWKKLRGFDYMVKMIEAVQFSDGIEVIPEIQIAAWFLTQKPFFIITNFFNNFHLWLVIEYEYWMRLYCWYLLSSRQTI